MDALKEFFKSLKSFIYLNQYSKKLYGSPRPANEIAKKGFDEYVRNRESLSCSKFFLIVKLKGKRPSITHQKFTNKLWKVHNNDVDMFSFFFLIHKKYTSDVVKWGISCYKLADLVSQENGFTFKNNSFSISFPLKIKTLDDKHKYVWVNQECFPWEVDENNRIYSHLNEYTILDDFDEETNRKLFSVVRSSDYEQTQIWNEKIIQNFQLETLKTFAITPKQTEVLLAILSNPDFNLQQIANELGGISKNTITKHTSAVLIELKKVFPNLTRLKQIIAILKRYGIDNLTSILRNY